MRRMSTSLQECEAILIDAGGTLTSAGAAVPGAPEFTHALRRKRIPHYILSNTTISSAAALTSKLNGFGFAFEPNQLITANRSAMHLMKQQGIQSLFVIGTASQKDELHEAGFTVLGHDAGRADAVLASLDEHMDYAMLATAVTLLRNGARLIATNADRFWLDDGGRFMPDTGPTIAYLQQATGKDVTVTGKPTQTMMEFAVAHTGVPAQRMAIIGDQFASDMQMAQEFGMVSVLVLSGQTTRDDLVSATYQPDYVVESISHLTPLFQ